MERAAGPDQVAGGGASGRLAARFAAWVRALRGPSTSPLVHLRITGSETVRPDVITARTAVGALFTNRGIGYASTNEDAAVVGVLPSRNARAGEIVFAGVFDQAGGMGKASTTGAASAIAARRFEEACRLIAGGQVPARAVLEGAIMRAHAEVRGLGVNAATTFAASVFLDGEVVVANAGDSAVLHYGIDGRLKHQTASHNLGDEIARMSGDPNDGLPFSNRVTSAVGGAEPPRVDVTIWRVTKGDSLVFATDGITDANLQAQRVDVAHGLRWSRHHADVTAEQLGELVARHVDAPVAAMSLVELALHNMESGLGKPDNLAVVVIKVL